MQRKIVFIICSVLVGIVCITSCVHKPQVAVVPANGNFPDSIANILLTKCTNAGCHNQASYQNAAGLLLDSWEHLFQGYVSGAAVIAYSTQYSPLLYYCNAYDSADVSATDPGHLPTPITLKEYNTLKNWIAAGAPDRNGNIPFATNAATRQKIYLTVQGCNLLAVIDAKSKLIMRYIPVGDANNKSPHDIEISSDGRYGYTPLFNGNYVEKIDLLIDTAMNNVNLQSASGAAPASAAWSIITLSPADTSFIVSGTISNGCLIAVNTAAMHINTHLSIDAFNGNRSAFPAPHGIATNATFDTFYATLQTSVTKYAFGVTGAIYQKIIPASGQPHQIVMAPDRSKYFVTCPDPTTNHDFVRVYDIDTDTLIKAIPVGAIPQEMDISASKDYLFVACMEDAANPLPDTRGSVYVIDCNTLDVVKIIYGDFYQPHDVTVDEQDGLVFIPSRNANPNGPAPHHATACGGRSGWYSVYDLNTLLPVDGKRYEAPTDPYSISTRFK